ncbi:MAG TPA: pseudouridine-5'-phosphate glycosidase [Aggregatilineales bacterium]|nr:pseudouridine-5'-phosphate glycosidase [Anaerolineales bacterium]HRE49438.1 pseudouridine-5'-phosphate glycosidase [Aggregatilineales bacterium]
MSIRPEAVTVHPEVREALAAGMPVVALESTIIAHGMPYPTNLEVAHRCEQLVREAGAVPATLAILGGVIRVGLSAPELEYFATSQTILKAVERDFPMILARKADAAVTAGSSLAIAAAAGISVFVTGGIGGVGASAAQDFDISADLLAIAEYPVLTVCSGTKAFMDIPATLEYLETLRVPVIGYRFAEFPMFYTRGSGVGLEWVAQSPAEVAAILAARLHLSTSGGVLLGVPVPETAELPAAESRAAIQAALAHLREKGISGKGVTPFVLNAIKEYTGAASLRANVALIENNARVGAEIAAAFAK